MSDDMKLTDILGEPNGPLGKARMCIGDKCQHWHNPETSGWCGVMRGTLCPYVAPMDEPTTPTPDVAAAMERLEAALRKGATRVGNLPLLWSCESDDLVVLLTSYARLAEECERLRKYAAHQKCCGWEVNAFGSPVFTEICNCGLAELLKEAPLDKIIPLTGRCSECHRTHTACPHFAPPEGIQPAERLDCNHFKPKKEASK